MEKESGRAREQRVNQTDKHGELPTKELQPPGQDSRILELSCQYPDLEQDTCPWSNRADGARPSWTRRSHGTRIPLDRAPPHVHLITVHYALCARVAQLWLGQSRQSSRDMLSVGGHME